MVRIIASLVAGLLFGLGLCVSQMINPAVVLAFLDVAAIPAGGWDPSLAFVMAGALAVTATGYRLTFRRPVPLFAERFALPPTRPVNGRLIAGAALFGLGWGLAGYCPGPAIAGLGVGEARTWTFVAAMLLGMGLYRWAFAATSRRSPAGTTASPRGTGTAEKLTPN